MTVAHNPAPPDPDHIAGQVQSYIETAEVQSLLKLIEPLHPADIAEVMERLDRFEQNFLFDALDPEVGSQVLIELEDATREDVLEDIDEHRIPPMVDELESDDAADLVGELDEDVRERVLRQVPESSRAEVEKLLTYPEDTAGGIMALEVPWVDGSHTVGKAVEMVRRHHRDMEDIHEIFVVDDHHNLVGDISPLALLLNEPETPISEVMDGDTISVLPETDQEEAAALATKYDLIALPVVDRNKKLLGVISYDDIFDVIEEEEQEDISYFAGTGEDEPAERSVLKAVRARGPWLLLGLIGCIGSAVILYMFEGTIQKKVSLAFFLPAIMAMAGSVAIQASSLVVRGLAAGSFALHGVPMVLWRELRISVLLGVTLGLILGLFHFIFEGQIRYSVCILTALALVVVTAAISGTLIPLILRRMGIDPAVAMGPFITTMNDVMGITIYFLVIAALL